MNFRKKKKKTLIVAAPELDVFKLPHWNDPLTPEIPIEAALAVVEKKSVDAGDGDSFVSQLRNKLWF